MFKIDLHTHSIGSPDGGLSVEHYRRMLTSGGLQAVAVTDHDSVSVALALRKQLGNQIIIGQEITTTEGEIIGLFLKRLVPPALSPEETIQHIRRQNGLVYIPHPFETVRQGLSPSTLERIIKDVDILEIHNGRAYFQNKSLLARRWANDYKVAGAASSDAHGWIGWGRTYSRIAQQPTAGNLVDLLQDARYAAKKVGPRGILYPKLHRVRKRLTNA